MKFRAIKLVLLGIVMTGVFSCSDDDGPGLTVEEQLIAHPWIVDDYQYHATAGGITLDPSILASYISEYEDEVPLNGTLTFAQSTFSVQDQGVTLTGTWSLQDNDSRLVMVFDNSTETFEFEIINISNTNLDLAYSATETIDLGTPVAVTFTITILMVPA